jgi:5-methylcytosine-specific restriction endonuclease McrA
VAEAKSRTGSHWRRIKARVIRRDHGICHLCGRPGADTADHVIPVSLGGAVYDLRNLRAAHDQPCNRVRGNRSIEWARAELIRTGRAAPTVAPTSPDAWSW